MMRLRNCLEMAALKEVMHIWPLSVLEFYSGTGGMHYALMEALGDRVDVVAAFDINTTVNSIYRHNFPKVSSLVASYIAATSLPS